MPNPCDTVQIMELLTVLLVPSAFVYYAAGKRFANLPAYRIAYGSGVACGLLLVIMEWLVFSRLPWNTAHPAILYLIVLFSVFLLPFIAGPALLNAVFRSESRARIARAVPQLFGIVSIYLPYILITRFPFPDIWILAVVPVCVVAMIFMADRYLIKYESSIRLGPTLEGVFFALVPVLFFILVLPLLVVLWHFCLHPLFYWIPSLALVIFSAIIRIKRYL